MTTVDGLGTILAVWIVGGLWVISHLLTRLGRLEARVTALERAVDPGGPEEAQ